MRDLKPLFNWARDNGDANIYDRILMKVMPQFINENIHLTSQLIESSESINISEELYELVLQKTEELVGAKYV